MSNQTETLDVHEVVARWLADVRSDKASRYLYQKRAEHLELLVQYFLEHKIDRDDAMSMKRKVVEYLVTPEGMKGKEKHKGWKENAENDFDDAVLKAYIPTAKPLKPLKGAHGYDERIVKWAKNKFGPDVREEIIKAAHQPLHSFWIMWMNDQHNLKPGKGI